MQCSPDSLSLLANTICAVDRFPLIFHFSSKPALPRSPIHFAEQSIRTLFHCPFISPAALFPCVSSQWQINRLQTKETVRSKNQYRIFSLACNSDLPESCKDFAIKFYETSRRFARRLYWTKENLSGLEAESLANSQMHFYFSSIFQVKLCLVWYEAARLRVEKTGLKYKKQNCILKSQFSDIFLNPWQKKKQETE